MEKAEKIEKKRGEVGRIGKRHIKSVEWLRERIESYFKTEGKHTYMGLVLHLGFKTRQTFENYRNMGKPDEEVKKWKKYDVYGKKEKIKITELIEEALMRIEKEMEEELIDQKTRNVTGIIFALKNRFKWSDRNEAEVGGVTINLSISGLEDVRSGKERDKS